ncbi:hypothetical protein PMZ80_005523 [Knufia obscura]|uniref:Uncharacterized protein n=2 Tax=Knufia TaxID=430999 RepID=A0AAN8EG62_9EURO|nr:hypothetical protein PMZ80_005523 [Knufia obscura]KAK5949992.1 hypothetical protein OHC33_008953 [Knufia fluminis]
MDAENRSSSTFHDDSIIQMTHHEVQEIICSGLHFPHPHALIHGFTKEKYDFPRYDNALLRCLVSKLMNIVFKGSALEITASNSPLLTVGPKAIDLNREVLLESGVAYWNIRDHMKADEKDIQAYWVYLAENRSLFKQLLALRRDIDMAITQYNAFSGLSNPPFTFNENKNEVGFAFVDQLDSNTVKNKLRPFLCSLLFHIGGYISSKPKPESKEALILPDIFSYDMWRPRQLPRIKQDLQEFQQLVRWPRKHLMHSRP